MVSWLNFQMDRKRKGGAEKQREKKKRMLASEAEKCSKLTDIFAKKPVADMLQESEHEVSELDDDGKSDLTSQTVTVPTTDETAVKDDLFERPEEKDRGFFFTSHPVQPMDDESLKFSARKAFRRKGGSQRIWLSYSQTNKALYCSVCLAYLKESDSNAFTEGMRDWKHVYQRIKEHECSKQHNSCVEAHMLSSHNKDIHHLLLTEQCQLKNNEIRTNRQVVERVVEIVKVIGKRGLSYRGSKAEAAYTLDDQSVDHGNFLELLILLSKYDSVLQKHLDKVVKKSKEAHAKGNKRRGNQLTFISKTMVNYVIEAISSLIKKTIADEIREAGMYSVQLDTTQDVSVKDQCSVILRYMDKFMNIQERLLAVVNCTDSTGQGILGLLKTVLNENNLDIKNCIANATDGAANMQGVYNGFSAWLSEESPGQVHVWCYSHVLNLVLSDATRSVMPANSLFSLLNGLAVFFRESYKRMAVLDNISDHAPQRLQTIGETRWWAKEAALRKIFGSSGSFDKCMYVDVLLALSSIEESNNITPELRVKAKSYMDGLVKYETVMTAAIFTRIFAITSPLSKYLQTEGLDLLTAQRMVTTALDELLKLQRGMAQVQSSAKAFIDWATNELQNRENDDIIIETHFQQKRIRRKKRLPGENASDEVIPDADQNFEVNVYNRILDTTVESIRSRFNKNAEAMRDLACLSPMQFEAISERGLPDNALCKLSDILSKYDQDVTDEQLRQELVSLASSWDRLKSSLKDEFVEITSKDEEEIEDILLETSDQGKPQVCKHCMKCPVCVYHVLVQYNLFSEAYVNISLAYKYLLSLSTTQVACERSFSTLKFVKNRLRSTLSAENLEAFMLMAIEKDILATLDVDTVINTISHKSSLLRSELFVIN